MSLTDQEQESEYNRFMGMLKEAIEKIRRYELEVKNLRNELKEKDLKINKILKDYDSVQSFTKGTNDKDKIRLKELFNVKFVANGNYGEGFFDALRIAEKHYALDKLNEGGKNV